MTLRTGMANLVRQLRGHGAAAEDEYTLAGETYWSDDHLQERLDYHRADVVAERLNVIPEYSGTADRYEYFNYYWKGSHVEELSSGSAAWVVKDDDGNVIGTADYAVDYPARRIRFNTDTRGESEYYLSYRAYDVYAAAADVWSQKAANAANRFDVRTDNHDLKRSQLMDMALKQAKYFTDLSRRQGGVNTPGGGRKEWVRVDVE
jgi:hypothetical protein